MYIYIYTNTHTHTHTHTHVCIHIGFVHFSPEMGQLPPFRGPFPAPHSLGAAAILNLSNDDWSALRRRQEYKGLLHSNKPGERHSGRHSEQGLKTFAILIAAPQQGPFTKTTLFHVLGPHTTLRCGFWDGHRTYIYMYIYRACIYVYIHIYVYTTLRLK